jgi:hypothetical protein
MRHANRERLFGRSPNYVRIAPIAVIDAAVSAKRNRTLLQARL